MDKEFIDLFFSEGKLRISSFEKFRGYSDEVRGDKSEGSGSISGKPEKDGFTFHLMTRMGENGYMLSTSLGNSETLKDDFQTSDLFKIKDPINFATSISNAVIGCNQISLGYCNYQEYKVIEKVIAGLSFDDFTNEKGNLIVGGPSMNKRIDQMIGNGIDLLYLKTLKYQNQAEFRFIWFQHHL